MAQRNAKVIGAGILAGPYTASRFAYLFSGPFLAACNSTACEPVTAAKLSLSPRPESNTELTIDTDAVPHTETLLSPRLRQGLAS